MAEPILEAELAIQIPGADVQVGLQVGSEIAVVFGPSGAGKSLTLRALAGLVRPSRGLIRLGGRTLFDSRLGIDLPPQRRRVGYVPQHYALFPHRTIAGNVAYALHRQPRAERTRRVGELLHLMRLEDQAQRLPGQVSGGQQQRAALARALAAQPDLLLMDEPFGALEESLRTHLGEALRRAQARFPIPVVLVTHNLAEAYSLADRLVVIDRGRVLQSGPRDELFRRPANPKVAALMGMTNILRVAVVDAEEGRGRVDWQGVALRLDASIPWQPGQATVLGIRPEEIMFVRRNRPLEAGMDENLLEGVIVDDRPQGFDHLVTVALQPEAPGERRLSVRIPHPIFLRLQLAPGQRRTLAIKPSSLHVFAAG